MNESSTEFRELVGLFHSPDDVEEAISMLTSSGWDHADLSLLGQHNLLVEERVVGQAEDLADNPDVGRQPPISETDVRQVRTLATSMTGLVAAFLASGATIMTGGGALAAVIGAAAAGGGAGVLVEVLGQRAGSHRDAFLNEQVDRGGILLWVRIKSEAEEKKAREILSASGSTDIHLHTHDMGELRDEAAKKEMRQR